MKPCYLCEEWYVPTAEELEAFDSWDPANWICPGCEEALAMLDRALKEIDEFVYEYEEEDYGHPF